MTQIPPYHCINRDASTSGWLVYHDDDSCPDGQAIPVEQRAPGTGFRTPCVRCLMRRRPTAQRRRRRPEDGRVAN